ncbi:hypothetical protein DPMN_069573 [Dreissena polymorpha]|uniref:Uncharacterized protein n=1 Tax=Dreissena polymorpha TaxID=45954 RepID=A0A9D3Z3U8_DREPO|nr:hypothetical protein DPMN_069573 [Dreissena polymorpha]
MFVDLSKKHSTLENKIKNEIQANERLTNEIKVLKSGKDTVRNEIVDAQARSMRDNLLFFNLEEGTTDEDRRSEDCRQKILNFCEYVLEMVDAKSKLKIDRAHRIGRFRFNKHRPVVVKFNYYHGKIDVKQRARAKKHSTPIRVADQFPKEIHDRRRKLILLMNKCRSEGKNDKLEL